MLDPVTPPEPGPALDGEWKCPNCDERHVDFADRGTYCRQCGLVVWVGRARKGSVDLFTDWLFMKEEDISHDRP